MFFLRRDIDPWYEDDVSANYIQASTDRLWIDRELVAVQSVTFFESAMQLLRGPFDPAGAVMLLRGYAGKFAPEFEYEDWASAWRDRVHAAFLHVAELTSSSLIASSEYHAATELAQQTLGVDSDAHEVERPLRPLSSTHTMQSGIAMTSEWTRRHSPK